MWYNEGTFYQIYPLGFCGAERENDFGDTRHRLGAIGREIGRLKALGVKAVLFNPLFESERHGYDTVDFFRVDRRLGTNEELKQLVKAFHEAGIRVLFDGVFHHVGRAHPAFRDVLLRREQSDKCGWFYIDFWGNSPYGDGLGYADWEGHAELVKLNLENAELQSYLMDAVRFWMDEFDIDGLRLDVCYLLPPWFLEMLRAVTQEKKEDFFLLGEVIHVSGYVQNVVPARLDSITNYECYKGMTSAFNSKNLFEIEHSLTRLFSDLPWALYRGKPLLNFTDNHDVTRAASALRERRNLENLYTLLFTMPGIPCLYYGSEYGAEGEKGRGDEVLRPCIDEIEREENGLYVHIAALSHLRGSCRALMYGNYEKQTLSNEYFSFLRAADGEKIFVAINIGEKEAYLPAPAGQDVFTGEKTEAGTLALAPFSSCILKAE